MKINYTSKTFWGGITGVVGAAAGFFTGALGPQEAIGAAFFSIMAIFLRDSNDKIEKKVEEIKKIGTQVPKEFQSIK